MNDWVDVQCLQYWIIPVPVKQAFCLVTYIDNSEGRSTYPKKPHLNMPLTFNHNSSAHRAFFVYSTNHRESTSRFKHFHVTPGVLDGSAWHTIEMEHACSTILQCDRTSPLLWNFFQVILLSFLAHKVFQLHRSHTCTAMQAVPFNEVAVIFIDGIIKCILRTANQKLESTF